MTRMRGWQGGEGCFLNGIRDVPNRRLLSEVKDGLIL